MSKKKILKEIIESRKSNYPKNFSTKKISKDSMAVLISFGSTSGAVFSANTVGMRYIIGFLFSIFCSNCKTF